jgi:hypothetical protein
MQLVKCVPIALYSKVKLMLLPVVAHCLLESKWLVKLGALLGPRKLKYHFFLEPGTLVLG